jgi:hypothetical protein
MMTTLNELYRAVRAATRKPADWDAMADAVARGVRSRLPPVEDVLRAMPDRALRGRDRSHYRSDRYGVGPLAS